MKEYTIVRTCCISDQINEVNDLLFTGRERFTSSEETTNQESKEYGNDTRDQKPDN